MGGLVMVSLRYSILLFCFLHYSNALAFYSKVDCIGSKESNRRIVYLHGWDSKNLSKQEKQNRKMWQRLAKKHNLRVALPRGNGECSSKKKQCWKIRNNKEVDESFSIMKNGANSCFGDKDFSIVGFSNGGYFASAIFERCLVKKAKFILAIGSASLSYLNLNPSNECGPFILQIGTKDITRKKDYYLL